MRYIKQFFLETLLNRFLNEGHVENLRFPRDLVKRFQNILKQIKQNIKTNTGSTCGTRSSNFSFLASPAQMSQSFLHLFTDCVYIDSQRPDVAYFICAIKEFRMVSFLSLFFFPVNVYV